MKGLIEKIDNSEYTRLSEKALSCVSISALLSFLAWLFYLGSYDSTHLKAFPSGERTILAEDPNLQKVKILKKIEEATSLEKLKSELQSYSSLDSNNFYPFAASLKYLLKTSITSPKNKQLKVHNLEILREAFKAYELYFDKKTFNDFRTFEHKHLLESIPKNQHTQSIKNQYLHELYLKHIVPLNRFFHLYLTVDVNDEETFNKRLEKVFTNLDHLLMSESFNSVRVADALLNRLDSLIETSPQANYETLKRYQEKVDVLNSQFAALEQYWPQHFYYMEIYYNNGSMINISSFNNKVTTRSSASFYTQLIYTLTPALILLFLGYSILALYRWKLTYKDIATDTYKLNFKDYSKALLFSTFFSVLSFFAVPALNTSHTAFLYQTLLLLVIFINFIYFLPLYWLRTKLVRNGPENEELEESVCKEFKTIWIKVLIYILASITVYLAANTEAIIFTACTIYLFEGAALILMFMQYLVLLGDKKLSKWSLSNSRLVLNFSSFSILFLTALTLLIGPLAQKYWVVNDPIFHYEVKNEQIQPKAYSFFMKSLQHIRKSPYEKYDRTTRTGKAYTIEIEPVAK